MPPKRKSARKIESPKAKKPYIRDGRITEKTADKMAARKLNNADLHEELQVILGEKVSAAGITFVAVPETSCTPTFESEDPLAPLDLSVHSQTADATNEPIHKIVLTQTEYETQEHYITQNLFENEQDMLGREFFAAPDDTQPPEDNCGPPKPVDFDIDFDAADGDEIPRPDGAEILEPDDAELPEPDDDEILELDGDVLPEPDGDEIPEHEILTVDANSQSALEEKCKRLEAHNKRRLDQLKKCRRKLAKVEEAKLSSDDYALRVAKELQMLKDKEKIPQACFTEEDGIPVTVRDLDELNDRATSDSMFVGLLATRLIGAERLTRMSVTGQASHRFAKMKKPDGTPLYPTPEKMEPAILEFICNKVAERTALRIGPENVKTIRKRSESTVVKRFIAQKIANLKKAALVRQTRNEGHQLRQSAVNVRV